MWAWACSGGNGAKGYSVVARSGAGERALGHHGLLGEGQRVAGAGTGIVWATASWVIAMIWSMRAATVSGDRSRS